MEKQPEKTTEKHLSTDYPLCEKDEQAKAANKAQKANEEALKNWRDTHKEATDQEGTYRNLTSS